MIHLSNFFNSFNSEEKIKQPYADEIIKLYEHSHTVTDPNMLEMLCAYVKKQPHFTEFLFESVREGSQTPQKPSTNPYGTFVPLGSGKEVT